MRESVTWTKKSTDSLGRDKSGRRLQCQQAQARSGEGRSRWRGGSMVRRCIRAEWPKRALALIREDCGIRRGPLEVASWSVDLEGGWLQHLCGMTGGWCRTRAQPSSLPHGFWVCWSPWARLVKLLWAEVATGHDFPAKPPTGPSSSKSLHQKEQAFLLSFFWNYLSLPGGPGLQASLVPSWVLLETQIKPR